ncbi:DUF1883 domain-containing protein [Rhizobium sp. NLR22b]|nr:DUF1883 domain-containing protein [Rhizobium sp. NLR22b]
MLDKPASVRLVATTNLSRHRVGCGHKYFGSHVTSSPFRVVWSGMHGVSVGC